MAAQPVVHVRATSASHRHFVVVQRQAGPAKEVAVRRARQAIDLEIQHAFEPPWIDQGPELSRHDAVFGERRRHVSRAHAGVEPHRVRAVVRDAK